MDSDPRVRLIAVIGFLFWLGVSVNGIQSVPLAIISWAVAGAIGIWLLWTWTPPRVAGNIWKVAASIVVLFALWFLTSLLNPQYLAERREIYQQFQSELERRSGFYGEGFMKILGIELLDRNDPNYRSTLERRIEDHNEWIQEKAQRDADFAALLARIKAWFPRSLEVDNEIAILQQGIPMATPDAPDGSEEIKQRWAQGQATDFTAIMRERLRTPARALSKYMEENLE